MKRLTTGMLMLVLAGCDQGSIAAPHEPDLQTRGSTLTPPTPTLLRLASWARDGEVVSKISCEDFTQTGPSSCYCNDDPALEGAPNDSNDPDKCVLCRWWQWEDGTCELDTSRDVQLEFVAGNVDYSFVDDGVEQPIDTAATWTLGCGDSSCPCDPALASCSCDDEYLDFAADKTLADGTIVSTDSSIVRLASGSCSSLQVSARNGVLIETQIACTTHYSVYETGCTCDDQGLDGTLGDGECVVCPWAHDLSCDLGDGDLSLVFVAPWEIDQPSHAFEYVHDGIPTAIPLDTPWVLDNSGQGSCSCSTTDCGCTNDSLDFEVIALGPNPSPLTQRGTGSIGSGG